MRPGAEGAGRRYALNEKFSEQAQRNDIGGGGPARRLTAAESAAGEESAAIAVLQTTIRHNDESLTRLEQELSDAETRRENLQSQIDGQMARVAEIDSQTAALSGSCRRCWIRCSRWRRMPGRGGGRDALRAQGGHGHGGGRRRQSRAVRAGGGLEAASQRRETVEQELTAHEKLESGEKGA